MKNNIRKIKIDNFTIRVLKKEDAKLLKDAIDTSLDHLRTFMDFAKEEPLPLQHKIDKIEKWEKAFVENSKYTYGIFIGNKLLGNCSLYTGKYNKTTGSVLELGYWIRASEINKGIATIATLALLKIAFEYIKIERVEIHLYKKNIASSKIPEKLGFTKMQDYTYDKKNDSSWYLMTKEEYLEKKLLYNQYFKDIEAIY